VSFDQSNLSDFVIFRAFYGQRQKSYGIRRFSHVFALKGLIEIFVGPLFPRDFPLEAFGDPFSKSTAN